MMACPKMIGIVVPMRKWLTGTGRRIQMPAAKSRPRDGLLVSVPWLFQIPSRFLQVGKAANISADDKTGESEDQLYG